MDPTEIIAFPIHIGSSSVQPGMQKTQTTTFRAEKNATELEIIFDSRGIQQAFRPPTIIVIIIITDWY